MHQKQILKSCPNLSNDNSPEPINKYTVQIALPVKEKLNIGILMAGDHIPKWQFELIEVIRNSSFATIALVIKQDKKSISKFPKLFKSLHESMFQFHLKLDEFIFGKGTDYSKIFDSRFLLNDINKIKQADVETLKKYRLDIVLNLTSEASTGDIPGVLKFGVISYKGFKRTAPPGYREVVEKWGTTDSVILLNNNLKEGHIIHYSQMLTHYVSVTKNRNACYWRATATILHILKGIYNNGDTYLKELIKNNKKYSLNKNASIIDTNFNATKNIFKHFWKVSKRVIEKIFYKDHWDILYKFNSDDSIFSSLSEFKFLTAPSDRDWADPFVISENNKHYIFIEEMPYKTNKAHLSVLELDSQGNLLDSKKILEKNHHLSYPFIFKYEDTYYMIPETGANKTIELYKCRKFPYKWEFVMNLMENGYGADVTLFYHNNKWWLFCCMDKTGKNVGMLDELYVYFSGDLFTTDWQSHPQNPVCTSSRTARPAGKIFIKDGKIYRPSQDSTGIYGRGLNINEITKLSETEYAETLVKKIIPTSGDALKGVHTFNFNDKITVIDGFRHNRRIRLNKRFPRDTKLKNFYLTQHHHTNTVSVLD